MAPTMIPDWSLYLITDRHRLGPGSLQSAVAEAIRGGVRAVQLREKDLAPRDLIPLAEDIRQLTARAGARLFINGRIDVMLAVDADGVHLRSDSLPIFAVRKVIGPKKFLGVSTHSLAEVDRASDEGADFITFGPVFETPAKTVYGRPVGVEALQLACRRTRLPVYALGGVRGERIADVVAAGAHGVALIGAIMSSRDIRGAAQACLEAVGHARNTHLVDPG